ncbi:hypothetical protein PFISCL1PPCAC_4941 [Pristionchus fissidentatus]|uniref:F-box domain-containing protein n=1 Tax=Pristionchus fissidentatus TaxID=1538716 RepID=A0AAV5V6W5_9BILA|nr:hypothetical protein PFISCL1PPCAC_4941 [Pristionchus fissidentatus]
MDQRNEVQLKLLHCPNEVITVIIRNLHVRERLRLGSTCTHLNQLEKKTGGRQVDVVRLRRFPAFTISLGTRRIETDPNGLHPLIDFTTFFNNAHITCLDLRDMDYVEENDKIPPEFAILKSVSYDLLKVRGMFFQSVFRSVLSSFVHSPLFTRKAVQITWRTLRDQIEIDTEFFLSLPEIDTFHILWHVSSDEEITDDTLSQLIEKSRDTLVMRSADVYYFFEENQLLEIFESVCNAPYSKRVRLEGYGVEAMIHLLKADPDYEVVNQTCIRHVPTRAVMIHTPLIDGVDVYHRFTMCKGYWVPESLEYIPFGFFD